MTQLKDGVVWQDMHPKIEDALQLIEQAYKEFNTELVVTSARDGKHMTGSLHYEGKAIDTRTWSVLNNLVRRIKALLGPDYDVVLEADHIHLEISPLGLKKLEQEK